MDGLPNRFFSIRTEKLRSGQEHPNLCVGLQKPLDAPSETRREKADTRSTINRNNNLIDARVTEPARSKKNKVTRQRSASTKAGKMNSSAVSQALLRPLLMYPSPPAAS